MFKNETISIAGGPTIEWKFDGDVGTAELAGAKLRAEVIDVMSPENIKLVSTDRGAIELFSSLGLRTGVNPIGYWLDREADEGRDPLNESRED